NSTILVAAAAVLVTCSTASDAKFRLFGTRAHKTQVRRAPQPQPVPYHWTQGAAPKAHRDLVARFGRVGLSPGQYVWAAVTPADGETHIVVDLLTQMTYVYRGEQLIGASSM